MITLGIPPTRFELVSPDPKSCMIDRYTTGVLDKLTATLARVRFCDHIPFMSMFKLKKALMNNPIQKIVF